MVISLCGFYPDEITKRGIKEKNIPIYWLEARNDTVLTAEKKSSYKKLLASGCNLKYILDEKSDHDNLLPEIISQLD